MLIIGASLLAVVWLCDPRIALTNSALVLTNGGTALLSSPAEQSDKLASLPQGSILTVLSQRGRWFYGELPDGKRDGFSPKGLLL